MTRKWVKLWCSFDEDNLTLEEIGAWHILLKLAGKSFFDGVVSIDERLPYTHRQLAVYFNSSPNKVKKLLQTLTEKDRIEVMSNGFLKLKNWLKYQSEYDRTKECPSRKSTGKSTQESTPQSTPLEVDIDNRLKNKEEEEEVEKEPSAGATVFKGHCPKCGFVREIGECPPPNAETCESCHKFVYFEWEMLIGRR